MYGDTGGYPWAATHRVADHQLAAYSGTGPEATSAPPTMLDLGLELRVLERNGNWAQVEASNGWIAWVDGTRLTPITRTLPAGGLQVWERPDPATRPLTTADGGLPVTVLETTTGWAHVQFENGWSGWVDASALTAPPATAVLSTTPGARTTTPLPAIGAALIVIGSFLPWLTVFGAPSLSAWDIPAWTLFTHGATPTNPKAGLLLLVPVLACLPYLTKKPLPAVANLGLAAIGAATAVAGLWFALDVDGVGPGLGPFVTGLGAAVMAGEQLVPFVTNQSARR